MEAGFASSVAGDRSGVGALEGSRLMKRSISDVSLEERVGVDRCAIIIVCIASMGKPIWPFRFQHHVLDFRKSGGRSNPNAPGTGLPRFVGRLSAPC